MSRKPLYSTPRKPISVGQRTKSDLGYTYAELLLLAHTLHVRAVSAREALLELLVEGLIPRRAATGISVVGLRFDFGGRRGPWWLLHVVSCQAFFKSR
jgi:hypothetical protein